MKAFDIAPWHCSRCGNRMNATTLATNSDPTPPREGDLSLCFKCAEMHIMHNGKFVALTDDELIDLPLDLKKYVSGLQRSLRDFNKSTKH